MNSKKIYAFLLSLYPESYQARFGEEMMQVFEDAHEEARQEGSIPYFWTKIVWDAAATISSEHVEAALQALQEVELMNYMKNNLGLNAFFKPTIAKVIGAAVLVIPLYPLFAFYSLRFALALPGSVSGIFALIALVAVPIAIPLAAAAAVSYTVVSAVAIISARKQRMQSE